MVEELGEGLDLKTTGGYVVLAPSMHASGRRYCWEGSSHPNETPAAPFPEWLFMLATSRITNGSGSAAPIKDKIPHGRQHVTLLSFGGSMRRRGAGEEEICAALSAMNRLRCEKPGSEANIRKLAKSLCKYSPDARANVLRTAAPDAPSEDGMGHMCTRTLRLWEGNTAIMSDTSMRAATTTVIGATADWTCYVTTSSLASVGRVAANA
jgi:hypothetical protein